MNVLLPRPSFNAVATPVAHGRLPLGRNAAIASVVLALHASLIWVLQSGSALHPPEVVVPVEVLAELIAPPALSTTPAPPVPRPAPTPPLPSTKPIMPITPAKAAPKTSVQPQVQPQPQPQPQPLAIAEPTPTPSVTARSLAPSPPSPSSTAAPSPAQTPAAGPATPPAPPAAAVQLPSSDADYLQNPKPAYPPLSKRLGEQGKVIVRVLIGADGQPKKAEPKQSSGFERLDQAALTTVMKWRYVPGKRGGVAEDMWFNVPINFVLE